MKRICIALLLLTLAALALAATPRQHRSFRAVADRPRGGGIDPNLVVWFTYDANWTGSSNFVDASGSGNNGYSSDTNQATYCPLFTNGTAQFDYDYTQSIWVNSSATTYVTNGSPFTLAEWIYLGFLADNGTASVFGKRNTGTYPPVIQISDIGAGTTITGQLRVVVYDGTTQVSSNGVSLVQSNWCHVAMSYDGTIATLYYNATNVARLSTAGLNSFANTDRWSLCRRETAATPQLFRGRIDDTRIYNRALSASEITNLFTTTIDATRPN